MTRTPHRAAGAAAALCALALAGACTGPAEPPTFTPPAGGGPAAQPGGRGGALDPQEILDDALGGAKPLASGSGGLGSSFGQELADPVDRGSVSFLFACTGDARVTLWVSVDAGGAARTDDRPYTCADTALLISVPVERAGSKLAFTGSTPAAGRYAYAFVGRAS
ncbi:hypothetical protein GCM10010123_03010 [Pilimelia anulata]|uniref:Uncharacterized protein n=1 Tax=Pilimelia anulata TaxID=53371 RepID=A0A8J3B3K5_9ACTN|nr:hypothetical protein [Pilimelia anulata]GGJ76423.1 hypothetical protein GCM10010123_03010 [Pilimelia anulata]